VIYVDETLQHFIVGMIFDGNGQNLTAEYVQENMPEATLEAAMSRLEGLPYIEEGKTNAPIIYVVADPNCPYCKALHDQSEIDLREGRLRIRWVLTSTLGHDGKSEFIYTVESRYPGRGAEILRQYYQGVGEKEPEYEETGAKSVAEANRFFNEMRIKGTPFLMFRTRSGNISMHMGAPSEREYRRIVSTL